MTAVMRCTVCHSLSFYLSLFPRERRQKVFRRRRQDLHLSACLSFCRACPCTDAVSGIRISMQQQQPSRMALQLFLHTTLDLLSFFQAKTSQHDACRREGFAVNSAPLLLLLCPLLWSHACCCLLRERETSTSSVHFAIQSHLHDRLTRDDHTV